MSTVNRALILLSVLVLAFVAALRARAQTRPEILLEETTVKVKPGEAQQWEAALKRLHGWERQHNDPFSSATLMVIAGRGTGQYHVTRFELHWSDFDKIDKFDSSIGVSKEIHATVAPYTESIEREFYVFKPDLNVGRFRGHGRVTLSRVVKFTFKPGSLPAVRDILRQMNVALNKTKWPWGKPAWFELAEGGGPQFLEVSIAPDWADFRSPTPSLRAELVKVCGRARASALMHEFNEHLLSVNGQVLRIRYDLSYSAAKR